MPNWVRNRITMPGIADLPLYKTYEDGHKGFDFNKLIPMPPELNVDSGSMTEECIIYYLTERCTIPVVKLPPDKQLILSRTVSDIVTGFSWLERLFDIVADRMGDATEAEKNEKYSAGRVYVNNFLKHGATTWYGWCNRNWGTKWNACDTIVAGDTLIFDTAWSFPRPIIEKLAEMYPDSKFTAEWSDEDVGQNCGIVHYDAGKWDEELIEDGSQEAFALYVELHGGSCNVQADEDGNLHYVSCDECKKPICKEGK